MKLVFATNNPNKLSEIRSLVPAGIEILSLKDINCNEQLPETNPTLQENALQKAQYVNTHYGFNCFADDTGLEIDALGGAPGVYSARYAGENCHYSDNVKKLLQEMANVPEDFRTAHFKTVIAFVGENMELVSEGTVEGLITTKPKGVGGFGYDPVFYVLNRGKTYSEMKMTEKNQISHRAKAIQNMTKLLESRFPKTFHQMEDIA